MEQGLLSAGPTPSSLFEWDYFLWISWFNKLFKVNFVIAGWSRSKKRSKHLTPDNDGWETIDSSQLSEEDPVDEGVKDAVTQTFKEAGTDYADEDEEPGTDCSDSDDDDIGLTSRGKKYAGGVEKCGPKVGDYAGTLKPAKRRYSSVKKLACFTILQRQYTHEAKKKSSGGLRKYGEEKSSFKVCKPRSLEKYEEAKSHGPKKYKETIEKMKKSKDSSKGDDRTCHLVIGEYTDKDTGDDATKVTAWEDLDKELMKIVKDVGLKTYTKGQKVATLSVEFMKKSKDFAKLYFPADLGIKQFLHRLAFAKDHKDVNEIVLTYASSVAIVARNDISDEVPSPLDVFSVDTFFQINKKKDEKDAAENGEDYVLGFEVEGHTDLTSMNAESISHTVWHQHF